jgi:hypothetical protein
MPKPDEDSDDAPPPPKKTDTKRKQRPDAEPQAPKKASGPVPTKKVSGESPAKKATAEVPSRKLSEGDADDPPPKTKTKRVAKEPSAEAEAAKDEDAPAEAKGDVKGKTGKRMKSDVAGKLGAGAKKKPGRERAPVAPPAPAKRGAFDFAVAVLGPLLAGGFGGVAFMLISQSKGRILSNPIFSAVNPATIIDQMNLTVWVMFPWAPIVVGIVVALLGSLVLTKMAPGASTRVMGVGLVIVALVGVTPFALAGRSLGEFVKTTIAKEYLIPRGAEVDVRALDMKPSKDFAFRQFLSTWKVHLEEGETPVAWLTNVEDAEASKDEKLVENERILTSADLRNALADARTLAKDFPKEIEELTPKLEKLRDACADATKVPTEESLKFKDAWTKFEGLTHGKLMKPPAPKGGWFTGFTTFGELNQEKGTSKADHAFYFKRYLGKAVHKACPYVPAEMRYAGAFIAYLPPDYVGKDPAELALTRYDRVFVCYDIENLDREPVVVPYIKGILDEARFRIEVLGEKN